MATEPKDDGRLHIPPIPRLCRYLSERSPQAMVAVDGTTHIVSYVNPAFTALVGIERERLIGRPFSEAVPEGVENGCLRLLDRVFGTGTAENLAEQQHLQAQLNPVYWSYAMWPILGADEHPEGVMIQVTDVTEIAIYRQQSVAMNESLLISSSRQHELSGIAARLNLRLQDAVRARDKFLAVLSHELRNPLAALSSGLQLLKLSGGDQAVAESAQEMMDRQLKQMVRLVSDLLDVSRITSGKLELRKQRVELASIVKDAVEASRALIDVGNHELKISLPSRSVWLDADPTRLSQVLLNLLHNAAKYSEPCKVILLTAKLEGKEVEISVLDQGIGIPATNLPHIFDVYMQVDTSWQRAQGGMGIGLSLVKEFVELHGGRVEVRSLGIGQGSEFLVRLPVAPDVAEAVEAPVAIAEIQRGPSRRILVVDDNRDAAVSLAMLLKLMGHDVRVAHDGEAAAVAADEYRPNLILMDLGMPKVDGYEAARRIRSKPWGAEPFLVALTGWGNKDAQRRTQDVGFDQHLIKPVNTDALVKLIADMPIKST